jgi:hypothetical protein
LPSIYSGSLGIFFLTEIRRDLQRDRTGAIPWLLAWGDRGILTYPSADFFPLRDYLQRHLSAKPDTAGLALEMLTSPVPRLRAEAAHDLSRISGVAARFTTANLESILSAIEDPEYPDGARTRLTCLLSQVPLATSALHQVLIRLAESESAGNGFYVEAARILASSTEPKAVEALFKLADSADRRVFTQALTSLGIIGTEEARARVVYARDGHPDPDIRLLATQILALNDPSASPLLALF